MKNKIYKITEQDLHRIIMESVNMLDNKFGSYDENEYKVVSDNFINHYPFNNVNENNLSLVKLTNEEKCNKIFQKTFKETFNELKENISLNNILKEELGINERIQDVSNIIIDTIKEHLEKLNGIKSVYGQVKKGFFELNIFEDYNLSVRFTNIDCNNKKHLNYCKLESTSSFNEHILNINCCSLDGILLEEDLFDSVYHEIEHIFEQIQRNKTYGDTSIFKTISSKVSTLMSNEDILSRKIGQVLYLSLNFEQQAFLNGAYGSIKNTLKNGEEITKERIDSLIKTTSLYKCLMFLKDAKNEESNERINTILESVGMTFGKYTNLFNETLKKITRRLGKLTVKLYKDYHIL